MTFRWSLVAVSALICGLVSFYFYLYTPSSPPRRSPTGSLGGTITVFKALDAEESVLTIDSSISISLVHPFIDAFQRHNRSTTIIYSGNRSTDLLARASEACATHSAAADLYLSPSPEDLVKLANDDCAAKLPRDALPNVTDSNQWRQEVVGFTPDIAVIIYNTRLLAPSDVPKDHIELANLLREKGDVLAKKIGIYDIEASGWGYNNAAFDARQSAIYGRLIEGFGRSKAQTYCCSNAMVTAVGKGEVIIAYNVQLSQAIVGQRDGMPIGIVFPIDYQALQMRTVMINRYSRNYRDAAAFIKFLVSTEGEHLAKDGITPPAGSIAHGKILQPRVSSYASVGPNLLALTDQARRARFINEWNQAIMAAPDEAIKGLPSE